MKAQLLSSGKYRARAYDFTDANGKKHYKSFTSSSKKEAERLATEFELNRNYFTRAQHITLEEAIDEYIASRRVKCSESTIYGYEKIRRNAFPDLLPIFVDKISTKMLEDAVEKEVSRGLAPKTVINNYGLIRATLKRHAPRLDTNVPLPRKKKVIFVPPEPDTVVRAVVGTDVELPVMLAMWLSFTLSEMKGLKRSSINGDSIQINQVVVYAGKVIEKDYAKVDSRTRKQRLPKYIKDLIDKLPEDQEYLVPEWGSTINNRLKKALINAGVQPITLHKCRHLFASITLAKLGINPEIVKDEGGWTTDSTVKETYTHTFTSDRIEADKKIDDYFYGILNANSKKTYEEFLYSLHIDDSDVAKDMYKTYMDMK